jgi:hypothetical protein
MNKPGFIGFETVRILSLLAQTYPVMICMPSSKYEYTHSIFPLEHLTNCTQTRPKAGYLQEKEQDIFLVRRSSPLINFKTRELTD